ncbi:MAG: heparinase II/III family protein [Bacteroidales bacterium]|nr:heparinase II/III family protein [Bacteroidales bacterium]
MRRILISLLFCGAALSLSAREARHVFETAYNALPEKAAVFRPGGDWFPYPSYSDHSSWRAFFTGIKTIVGRGQSFMGRDWSANPTALKHREALAELVLAELAEGKGQFIPEITKALETLVSLGYLPTPGSRPDTPPEQRIIALHEAAYGAEVALALFFFQEQLPRALCDGVYELLRANIFDPYLNPANDRRPEMNWMAIHFDPNGEGYLNNWCSYCTVHVLTAFLLAERDSGRLLQAVAKSCKTMDAYMDYAGLDGSCEEGPGYWNMAGAKVYEYARLMCDASDGKIDLLSDPQIRRMGEWRIHVDAGEGWVVNFSDGSARGLNYAEVLYRYGLDCGSRELVDYAILNFINNDFTAFRNAPYRGGSEGERIYRALESLRYNAQLYEDREKALDAAGGDYYKLWKNGFARLSSHWYPDNQQAFLRAGKKFLAAKGGHNRESHNHNDVGSFVLFDESMPVIIDPGLNHETYGKSNKYVVWSARSEWHNLPVINGMQQAPGRSYRAVDATADPEAGTFSADIAQAYPKEAACRSWRRSYALSATAAVVEDHFELERRIAPDTLHFVLWKEPFLPGEKCDHKKVKDGEVMIFCRNFDGSKSKWMRLRFPETLTVVKEEKPITDRAQKSCWGESLWRLRFASRPDAPLKGNYRFEIVK